jgi:4-hydroxybenzoate polyprenyltransferase
LTKDITKDLENLKGDFTLNYNTLPVVFGEGFTKIIIVSIIVINMFLVINLIFNFNEGLMYYYYYFSLFMLLVFLIKLIISSSKDDYLFLHNILRLIILVGVFCIALIKPNLF